MDLIKSSFIFELADKHGIYYHSDEPFEFTDEQYNNFCTEYIQACNSRDGELVSYLTNNPKLFRAFLPWRDSLFRTIIQMLWYYDELIVYDPIVFEITYYKTNNPDENKQNLIELLETLHHFKDSIQSGFLLFAGYQSLQKAKLNEPKVDANLLINDPEIRPELDNLVDVYKMEDQDDPESTDYTIRSHYRGIESLTPIIKTPKQDKDGRYYFNYNFSGSKYTPITVADVIKEGVYEKVYGNHSKRYSEEILETIEYFLIGAGLNTNVQFDRNLDVMVLQNLKMINLKPEQNPYSYYQLSLPTVNGIPTERLLEIRHQMPSAFLDFRNQMVDIISDLTAKNLEGELLKTKINSKIIPIVNNLDKEINNSLRKAKILGIGVPITSAVGAWACWQSGLDVVKLGGIIWGGASIPAELKILVDRLGERDKAKANPFYFLWKVQQTNPNR